MCAMVYHSMQAEDGPKRVEPVQEGDESPWLLGSAGDLAFQTTARVARDW